MVFDLIRLKNKLEDEVTIDMDYEFNDEIIKSTEIMNPFTIHLKGSIKRNSLDGFYLNVNVDGEMNLPCSVTLKPVPVKISIQVEGNLDELLEEMEENHKKIENSIDILPIIWENIVMEIPMKVTSPNVTSVKTEGEGWKFVTEENEEIKNPALEQLKDLL